MMNELKDFFQGFRVKIFEIYGKEILYSCTENSL